MTQLTIQLFGPFYVKIADQLVYKFRSNKVRALLACLVTAGEVGLPRDRLAHLLWDGYAEEAAHASLRAALVNLRQALAPFELIKASRQMVYLDTNHPSLWCDVLVLQKLLQHQGEIDLTAWQALAHALQHDFLQGLSAIDSAPFQAWRAVQQAAYRQQIERVEQKVARTMARPSVVMSPPLPSALSDRDLDLAQFKQRLFDPHYPFLTLGHARKIGQTRLALAVDLQVNRPFLQSSLFHWATRPPTLQAVLAGAWQILSPEARTVLLRCSIFDGSFTVDAALHVASATQDGVSQLVTHGLLHQVPLEKGAAALDSRRFHIPERVRQFAAVQLPPSIVVELQARHATYYLAWLATYKADHPNEPQLLAHLQADIHNIHGAWRWATDQGELALLANAIEGLDRYCQRTDDYLESAVILTYTVARLRALAASDSTQTALVQAVFCGLLRPLATCHRALGQYDQALLVTHEALAWAVRSQNHHVENSCYFELGAIAYFQGDYRQAQLMMEKGVALAQAHSACEWQARCLLALALIMQAQQDYAAALVHNQAALVLIQMLANSILAAELANNLGTLYLLLGDFAQAAVYLQKYMALSRQTGQLAIAQCNLGLLWLFVGDFTQAITALTAAQQLATESGNLEVEATCLGLLAKLWVQLDEGEKAEMYCQQALQVAEAGYFPQTLREIYLTQGHLRCGQGRWNAALAAYTQALLLSQPGSIQEEVNEVYVYIAATLLAQGETSQACTHIEAVLQTFDATRFKALQSPQRLLLLCHQVLAAVHDGRAPGVLQQAWAVLQGQAACISDQQLQQSFLTHVPFNRALSLLIKGSA